MDQLKSVLPISSSCSLFHCESCQLGKHTRSSYPSRQQKQSDVPLELGHSDVWGPCRVASICGFRYFVSFIDDFSRMTWVYLIKDRTQVIDVIKKNQ